VKTVCIIQARLNSTRLKEKMLLPLAGKPVLWHVINRVKRAARVNQVVVATPYDCSRYTDRSVPLWHWMTKCDVDWCHPLCHENDLVARYALTAKIYDADIVVRVCADNPCVDPHMIDVAIRSYLAFPSLFQSNTLSLIRKPDFGWVDGLGCEVFSAFRMQWLNEKLKPDDPMREHPHQFFEEHRKRYKPIEWYPVPEEGADIIHLDINTQDDYEKLSTLFDFLYPKCPDFSGINALSALRELQLTSP